ncbi:MAG: lamin tail domain-containing protein [Treponema sp.]|nr:lamin tail domain-containing protein [Treponema sp.]
MQGTKEAVRTSFSNFSDSPNSKEDDLGKLKMTPGMLLCAGALACAMFLAACPADAGDLYENGDSDPYEGKLLILQTYGTGPGSDGAVSHNFVELYNNSAAALDLTGVTLQYADGTSGGTAPADPNWKIISLSGYSIGAGRSFLILGKKNNNSGDLQLTDNSGDINNDALVLNNHAYKVALIRTGNAISRTNPFNPKMAGYIDMIGAVNDPAEEDSIGACETSALSGISKQKSARRKNFNDTDNNGQDFEIVDYRSSGVSGAVRDTYKPKTLGNGSWDPWHIPESPPPGGGSDKLMILHAYGLKDKNNDGNGATHGFVELYNNTGSAIDVSGYSLLYAGDDSYSNWTKVNLTGQVPSHCSYLIRGKSYATSGTYVNLSSVTPDVDAPDLYISNDSYVLVLMSTQTLPAFVSPFDTDGSGTKATGYVDMVGAHDGESGTKWMPFSETDHVPGIGKSKSVRRKSLTDTDDNSEDFVIKTLANTANVQAYTPKTVSNGAHTPSF